MVGKVTRVRGARRRTALLLVGVLIALGGIILPASPAHANHEDWGFSYLENVSGPPGLRIRLKLRRQISHDVPNPGLFVSDPEHPTYLPPEWLADDQCIGTEGKELVDRHGRAVALLYNFDVPDGTAPGRYLVRVTCIYGTGVRFPPGSSEAFFEDIEYLKPYTNPEYQLPRGWHLEQDCIRFDVTAPGTLPVAGFNYFDSSDGPLRSDPCPTSLWGLLDRGLAGLGIGVRTLAASWAGSAGGPPSSPPGAAETTTTTSGGGAAPPSTAPPTTAGGAPAGDSTPPSMGGVSVSPSTIYWSPCSGSPTTAGLTVPVTDPNGVGAVSVSWQVSGTSLSGQSSASGSGSQYHAAIGPISGSPKPLLPKSVAITVTAADTKGNTATAGASATLQDCPI